MYQHHLGVAGVVERCQADQQEESTQKKFLLNIKASILLVSDNWASRTTLSVPFNRLLAVEKQSNSYGNVQQRPKKIKKYSKFTIESIQILIFNINDQNFEKI